MPIKLNSTGGGSVTLDTPSTANNYTLLIPATNGSLATTTGTTFADITDSGNLTFTGTGNRILGDFSNATVANRVAFQSSTANGVSDIPVIPNGTATTARHFYYNTSDIANASTVVALGATSTEGTFRVSGVGTSPVSLPMTFYTGGSERMRIDTSGNVGIGLTPYYKLDISGTSRYNVDTSGSGVTLRAMNPAGSVNVVLTTNALYHTWQLSGGEVMRIDTSGNLLVGTTSAWGKCTVNGYSGAANLYLNGVSSGDDVVLRFGSAGTNKVIMYWSAASDRTYIATGASGGVYLSNGGTSWTSASDERVKDIVEPITNATEKLANWRTVIGKYKTDKEGTRRSFLIAQDVLATFPEAVDTDDETELGVRYQDTIPVLVKAIQELKAELDELKAKVNA